MNLSCCCSVVLFNWYLYVLQMVLYYFLHNFILLLFFFFILPWSRYASLAGKKYNLWKNEFLINLAVYPWQGFDKPYLIHIPRSLILVGTNWLFQGSDFLIQNFKFQTRFSINTAIGHRCFWYFSFLLFEIFLLDCFLLNIENTLRHVMRIL